jgi:hypothetical protein
MPVHVTADAQLANSAIDEYLDGNGRPAVM